MNAGAASAAAAFLLEPHEIARLEPGQQLRYRDILQTLIGGESFEQFVARLVPNEPIPRHGQGLADIFLRARLRQSLTLLSWPPGFAKTTLSVRGLAWWLSKSPSDPCGFVTYNDTKANRHSREVRDLLKRAGVRMDREASGVADWRTIYGGGLFAGGWRGKGTGYRVGGFLFVDDPYRSIDDAYSPTYRASFSNWIKAVASTRLQGGSIVNSHTRWHHLDAIGELQGNRDWRYINLPAIAEPGDPLGRAEGESLWPEQFPTTTCLHPCGHAGHLDRIREVVGEWTWAALYQGRPVPLTGGMFHAEWWQYADQAEPGRSVRAWDIASTKDARGPATVGVKTTKTAIGEYFTENVFRARLSPAGVDEAILAMARVDGKACRISLPQDPGQAGVAQKDHWSKMLDGYDFEITPEGTDHLEGGKSKVGRARPYAAQVEQGNYFLCRQPGWTGRYEGGRFELIPVANWHPEFIAEHALFPAGELADQVDAGSRAYHAHAKMIDVPIAISAGRIRDGKEQDDER